jgi:hypothetical protein
MLNTKDSDITVFQLVDNSITGDQDFSNVIALILRHDSADAWKAFQALNCRIEALQERNRVCCGSPTQDADDLKDV